MSINPDDTDNATISGNTITATHAYDGIVLCANKSTVTKNTINVADESGVNAASSCYGDASPTDTLTSNTINGACAGVLDDTIATLTITSDIYYNVGTLVLSSPTDACATPLLKKRDGSGPHRAVVSPARRKLSQ